MSKYKKETEQLQEKLASEKEQVDHWRNRALTAEKQFQQQVTRYSTLQTSYHELYAELEGTKKRLPTGAIRTHIENLIRLNESYRQVLTGERVSFWRRLWFVGRLLFQN